MQIVAASLAGSLAGIVVGVALVPLLGMALQGLLPVSSGVIVDPGAILLALSYGMLVALVFAAPPLLRARHFPAMALMRSRVAPLARDPKALLLVGGGLAAIVALALLTSANPLLSAGFLAGAAGCSALLALIGLGIRKLAGSPAASRAARSRATRWPTSIVPAASTGALVTALGFGLAAFVLLAAVQSAIDGNIAKRVPDRAPDYFVLDIPREQVTEFEDLCAHRRSAGRMADRARAARLGTGLRR